jgi:hypothetical protein
MYYGGTLALIHPTNFVLSLIPRGYPTSIKTQRPESTFWATVGVFYLFVLVLLSLFTLCVIYMLEIKAFLTTLLTPPTSTLPTPPTKTKHPSTKKAHQINNHQNTQHKHHPTSSSSSSSSSSCKVTLLACGLCTIGLAATLYEIFGHYNGESLAFASYDETVTAGTGTKQGRVLFVYQQYTMLLSLAFFLPLLFASELEVTAVLHALPELRYLVTKGPLYLLIGSVLLVSDKVGV